MNSDWHLFMDLVWALISSEGAPAWIQAIGSLVALFIAIRVSRLSVEHAGVLRQKTMFSVVEASHQFASSIRTAVELIGDEPGSNAELYNVYHKDVMAGMIQALQALPVHEFGTGRQVISTLGVTDQMVFLGRAAEKLLCDPTLLPEYKRGFSQLDGDRKGSREFRATITRVLKRNALTHLDKIEEFYKELKQSIPK